MALPTIAKELDATPAAIIWVVNAYHVASAATMITFAAVGAVFSYRRVYCIGLAIFTLTSIGCAVANDLWTLVAFRSLQGFSYAAMVSIGIGMYRKIYPPELLGSILGINALIVALGTVAGPTLGGIIVSTLGWPWLFLINVPFGVAALYLGLRNLPADEGSGARLDLSSIGYSVLAIGFVVIAIDQAGRWDNGIVWTLLACGAVLATVFLRRQRRLDAPLLPLDIFASKRFSFAAAASLAAFSAQGISFVALPFLFQSVYGYSAIQSALLFTPWPVVVTGRAAVGAAVRQDQRDPAVYHRRRHLRAGAVPDRVHGPCARRHRHPVAPGPVRTGLRLFQAPNNKEMLSNVARARSAASGVLATARTLGQSLGAAVVAVVLSGVASQLFASGKVGQMQTALWIAGAIAMASCCLSLVRIHR